MDINTNPLLDMDFIRFDTVIEAKRVLMVLFAAGGFIFLYVIQSYVNKQKEEIKMLKKAAQRERFRLESELKVKEIIEQRLKSEVENVGRELASLTLTIIQKNEILEVVKGQLKEMKSACGETNLRPKVNRMLNNINFSPSIEKDWEKFKTYFDQVHQGFFDNLVASFPTLNANDLKLCALLKLNLDTKQIASIMDISPESCKVARYRLRKKFNISGDQKLSPFLAMFDPAVSAVSKYSL